MPQFNIGSDCQVILIGPFGEIQLENETKFMVDPVNKILSTSNLDGTFPKRTVPGYWKGSIMFNRADSTADDLAQAINNANTAGVPVPNGTIEQTVYNILDGTRSTYTYSQVAFDVKSLGTFENSKEVPQEIIFEATLRTES
jgi:hypothetical protein